MRIYNKTLGNVISFPCGKKFLQVMPRQMLQLTSEEYELSKLYLSRLGKFVEILEDTPLAPLELIGDGALPTVEKKETTPTFQKKETTPTVTTGVLRESIPISGEWRNITDILSDGSWKGERCFVVGGGPSLSGVDLSTLKGELVIGVNRAIERMDPCILHTLDRRFLSWVEGKLGEEFKHKWYDSLATKTYCGSSKDPVARGCYLINRLGSLVPTIREGLPSCNNSGLSAILLAAALGCNPIYLLGFDCVGTETGKQDWWHTAYPVVQSSDVYKYGMIPKHQKFAKVLQELRVKVINLNPDSAIHSYPFGSMKDINPLVEMPIVVGYFTKGTGYEEEAKGMVASAHRMGLLYDVIGVDNLGSWQKNTQYKARVLYDFVQKYKGKRILYVDADARFKRFPTLLRTLNTDLGVFYRKDSELLSGTLLLNCNDAIEELVGSWICRCLDYPDKWDQKCLADVVEDWGGRVFRLPESYCRIFDSKDSCEDPVIVHYQASRRLRKEVSNVEVRK